MLNSCNLIEIVYEIFLSNLTNIFEAWKENKKNVKHILKNSDVGFLSKKEI